MSVAALRDNNNLTEKDHNYRSATSLRPRAATESRLKPGQSQAHRVAEAESVRPQGAFNSTPKRE
jgi:hypothetical protein